MSEKNSFKLNYWLTPFAFFYDLGVRVRNLCFNWGLLPSEEFPVPVISVGNLAVGGTGKTPHVEYLVELLKDTYKVAVLSRGYKRATKGFLLADDQSTHLTIGDEPFQIKHKYPGIVVAVDSDRRRGIRQLLDLPPEIKPDVVLLDDAFQHRYVTPSLSILLTDYRRLFYHDKVMPIGRLREPAVGFRRADVIIVTKCPDSLVPIDYRIIEDDMKLKPHQHIFFTHIKYGRPAPLFPDENGLRDRQEIRKDDHVVLLTGIANPELFIHEVESCSDQVTRMVFPDHHTFGKQDIKKINDTFSKIPSTNKYILVTEKDAARLLRNPSIPEEWKESLYCLPIQVEFSEYNNQSMDELVLNHILTFQRNTILR